MIRALLSRTTKSRSTSEVVVRKLGSGSCAGRAMGSARSRKGRYRIGSRRPQCTAISDAPAERNAAEEPARRRENMKRPLSQLWRTRRYLKPDPDRAGLDAIGKRDPLPLENTSDTASCRLIPWN